MQLITEFNKGIRFLLCAIDILVKSISCLFKKQNGY